MSVHRHHRRRRALFRRGGRGLHGELTDVRQRIDGWARRALFSGRSWSDSIADTCSSTNQRLNVCIGLSLLRNQIASGGFRASASEVSLHAQRASLREVVERAVDSADVVQGHEQRRRWQFSSASNNAYAAQLAKYERPTPTSSVNILSGAEKGISGGEIPRAVEACPERAERVERAAQDDA